MSSIPKTISDIVIPNKFVKLVNDLQVCAGHPDMLFVEFCKSKKGKLVSRKGDVSA